MLSVNVCNSQILFYAGVINMSRIKNESLSFIKQMPAFQVVFVYLTRVLLLFSCVTADSPKKTVFSLVALLLTYLISFLHVISKENSFLHNLSHRITTLISVSSLVSCFVGQTLGMLEKAEEYDIVMSLTTGIVSTLFGYYVTLALKQVENKRDIAFTASSALFIAGTIVFFREMIEFFCDFWFGTNICHVEFVGDDHWFFRVFGQGNGVPEQRPLYDMDEDMLISLLFALFTTAVLLIFMRIKYKHFYGRIERKSLKIKNLPSAVYEKICFEIEQIKKQTSVVDLLVWWMVRGAMLNAALTMDPSAERVKVIANLVGTFAITLLHFVFPKDSMFGKISYRVQTLVTSLVFISSYMGNYMFVYNNLPRFDLFLHFVSGVICVVSGYYVALTFFEPTSKKNIMLATVYAFCLSCFIIPFWEVTEFIGDFLFGSANQGFYWGPSDDSFFFKLFGHGVGNTMLYYLFDTVYDVLLAFLTTAVAAVALWIHLNRKHKAEERLATENFQLAKEKSAVKC